MNNTNNSFDLRQVLGELKDFVASRAGGTATSTHKPSGEQLETAVLAALAGGPKNAAEVLAAIALASAGATKMTSAQVHPVLTKLTETGSIAASNADDRKVFEITEIGLNVLSAAAENQASESAQESADETGSTSGWPFGANRMNFDKWLHLDPNFLRTAAKLAPTINDMAKTGTREQQQRATEVLEEARRQMHVILAEG